MSLKKLSLALLALFLLHKILIRSQPFGPLLKDIQFSTEVVDRNAQLLRLNLAADETYRLKTELKDISELVKEATLLYEDRYFYYHPGVNPVSVFRAFISTYITGDRKLGASTITMQLSRALFKVNSRTVSGKLSQIFHALKLEFLYSKDDILTAYFNLAPYGFNIEGVGAASLIYFDKEARRLSLLEALTLSVIPQKPYERTLHIQHNKVANPALKEARHLLLMQWIKAFPQNVDKKLNFDLELEMGHPRALPFRAPHLVVQYLKNPTSNRMVSTLDWRLQKTVEESLNHYMNERKNMGIKNAAALLVDTRQMEVLSYMGSADFYDDAISGQVDGVQARRSPGSALKPFAYALAMEQGLIHPLTMVKDAPAPFGTYTPDNFDLAFAGPLSATDALIHSRNIPAIQIAEDLNDPTLYDFLRKAGVPLNPDPTHYGLSIVLGTAEVTMTELVELYSSLNFKGKKRSIRWLKSDSQEEDEGIPLLTAESAFLTLDMLSKNPRPEGRREEKWTLNPRSVAWKTGTSVGFRDAWAIGIFDHYVMAVWVGNFSGEGNPSFVGRHAAGPLLFSMIEALSKVQQVNFPEPAPSAELNLTKVEFCALSGHLPGKHCPNRTSGYFIPGLSPISHCQVHRKIEVDVVTRLEVCPQFVGKTESRVYEYWSTDLLKLFRQAGIGRRIPPALHPICRGEAYGEIGPKILSPKKGITYYLRTHGADSKKIPLLAIGDGNIKKLFWYVNNERLGETNVNNSIIWTAKSGHHIARVTDEQGRSAEVSFNVEWVD